MGKPAPKGNKYHQKLKTPELRKEAYRQYCEHIAAGYPKQSWYFDHPELSLTWDSMEKYARDYPTELPSIQMKHAEAKSYKHWFDVLSDSAKGKNQRANTASLQMIMRNKFKWDKESAVTHSFEPEVRKIIAKWEDQK